MSGESTEDQMLAHPHITKPYGLNGKGAPAVAILALLRVGKRAAEATRPVSSSGCSASLRPTPKPSSDRALLPPTRPHVEWDIPGRHRQTEVTRYGGRNGVPLEGGVLVNPARESRAVAGHVKGTPSRKLTTGAALF